jgi:large subunit ribosomal protein L18
MLRITAKNQTRQRVHDRIRKKVLGTPERPRLNVYRSTNHIYVQLIDDLKGVTLVAASTADDRKDKDKKDARVTGGNVASAKLIGKKIAELAKEKGVTKVVFDRGGYIYHGRVKAVADAAREAGLQF